MSEAIAPGADRVAQVGRISLAAIHVLQLELASCNMASGAQDAGQIEEEGGSSCSCFSLALLSSLDSQVSNGNYERSRSNESGQLGAINSSSRLLDRPFDGGQV